MARFLFVVPPLTGHVNPTVAVGGALAARGHQVAWVGHPSVVEPLIGDGQLFPLPEEGPLAHPEQIRARAEAARGFQAFKQLWEDFFIPLAKAMLPGVERCLDDYRPDAVLVDQQTFAGALAARRRGLHWATLATTSARWETSLEQLPKVREWLQEQLVALQRDAGLEVAADLTSPELLLVFSSPLLAGPGYPPQTEFVGPAAAARRPIAFPWERLREGRRLFVSLGTLNAARAGGFYPLLKEALAAERMQVIVAASPEALPQAPENFLLQSPLPQLEILSKVQAVLCHAGHNTVCEALALGLPLALMPIRDDQPVVAQQVVEAGAGIRLRFGRTTPDELRTAIRRLFEEQPLRAAAQRIQASFAQAGGASAAASAIERLAMRLAHEA
jgi:MGT family glycosyltransferase